MLMNLSLLIHTMTQTLRKIFVITFKKEYSSPLNTTLNTLEMSSVYSPKCVLRIWGALKHGFPDLGIFGCSSYDCSKIVNMPQEK